MRCFESVEGMTSRSRDWDRRDWITDGTGTIILRVVSILSIGIISPAFHTLIGERARGVEPERKVCNRPCDAVVTDVDKVIMHEAFTKGRLAPAFDLRSSRLERAAMIAATSQLGLPAERWGGVPILSTKRSLPECSGAVNLTSFLVADRIVGSRPGVSIVFGDGCLVDWRDS